jgi:hypothetical protein
VKKLAREAAANAWLDAETAAGIDQVASTGIASVQLGLKESRPSSVKRWL